MQTPTIWTMVTTRKAQSSVSKADANHEKFTHAQHTANVANAKATRPSPR